METFVAAFVPTSAYVSGISVRYKGRRGVNFPLIVLVWSLLSMSRVTKIFRAIAFAGELSKGHYCLCAV
jgi:hypothetical protein